jgi:hypothetical protein
MDLKERGKKVGKIESTEAQRRQGSRAGSQKEKVAR